MAIKFIDYSKPGKGIDPNKPEPTGLKGFFVHYYRNFWLLLEINLLRILFSIPIVTMPAARAASARLTRDLYLRRHIWLWSDFVRHFKSNFKQALLFGLPCDALLLGLYYFLTFYGLNVDQYMILLLPMAMTAVAILLLLVMGCYAFLMMTSVTLPFWAIVRNSWKFTIGRFRKNFLLLLILGGLYAFNVLLLPATVLTLLLLHFSTCEFIIASFLWDDMALHIIKDDTEAVSSEPGEKA